MVGGDLEGARDALRAAGWDDDDALLAPGGAGQLRELDGRGVRYTLIHVGAADGEPGGTHERAHHRVGRSELEDLARSLRPRPRKLVTCLAFGYKHGMPPDPTWVVDVRFLDNPYWVEELRDLTGRDRPVADYVLGQGAAGELLERLEGTLRWALPRYQRDTLTVAFGCTGGRHRSVALAAEMARRIAAWDEFDVELVTRDLDR